MEQLGLLDVEAIKADATAPRQVPADLLVTNEDLKGARYLETYRGTNIFGLADGRIYLDGTIAVGSLDHARATLDHLAKEHSGDGR